MRLPYRFLWKQLSKGEGFFIPCLDTAKVRHEAMLAALRARIFDAKGVEGIQDGLIGVWLYRRPGVPSLQNVSLPAAPDPAAGASDPPSDLTPGLPSRTE